MALKAAGPTAAVADRSAARAMARSEKIELCPKASQVSLPLNSSPARNRRHRPAAAPP